MFEHFVKEVCCTETRCFGANERAAETQTFASENAVFVCADDFLVLTEKISDFSSADTHITGRNVHIGSDIAIKFGHERLAEAHDFGIALAGRVEVRAAFCAAHGQRSERVFESLLEAQKLHGVEINVFLKTKSAFERPDCVVELHAISAIYVIYTVVIHPWNAEDDLSFGFDYAFENDVFAHNALVLLDCGSQRRENFFDRLHKLRLIRVLQFGLFDDFTDV